MCVPAKLDTQVLAATAATVTLETPPGLGTAPRLRDRARSSCPVGHMLYLENSKLISEMCALANLLGPWHPRPGGSETRGRPGRLGCSGLRLTPLQGWRREGRRGGSASWAVPHGDGRPSGSWVLEARAGAVTPARTLLARPVTGHDLAARGCPTATRPGPQLGRHPNPGPP